MGREDRCDRHGQLRGISFRPNAPTTVITSPNPINHGRTVGAPVKAREPEFAATVGEPLDPPPPPPLSVPPDPPAVVGPVVVVLPDPVVEVDVGAVVEVDVGAVVEVDVGEVVEVLELGTVDDVVLDVVADVDDVVELDVVVDDVDVVVVVVVEDVDVVVVVDPASANGRENAEFV
jgi:hypothetical protein